MVRAAKYGNPQQPAGPQPAAKSRIGLIVAKARVRRLLQPAADI
jgi:hypothetical protein